MKKGLALGLFAYAAGGVATALYTAWLASSGKPHFISFDGTVPANPAVGLAQTVGAWPYAMIVNLRGG